MQKISWPNRLTLARILLVGPFLWMVLHVQDPIWHGYARWAALGIFFLMAVSDGLDGYLARRLREESAVGRFLDPLADKLLILTSVILLARRDTCVPDMRLPDVVAIIVIGKDIIIVLGFCLIYLITSRVYIDPRWTGKWCTTLQLSMVISVLLSPDLPRWLTLLPKLLWWVASVLAVVTVINYFQLGRRFVAKHEVKHV
ncbi:MAG TPA: CDP-alcohol phosphatidyltransferase family protein [Phycisphaerae bacterium]|nr:CDP-alcohol phosphatidyltransferase family protein [Phycisphaerae bacterium]